MEETLTLELNDVQDNFYEKAAEYWSNIDASVDGVLGGFGWISSVDIRGSCQFLVKLMSQKEAPPGRERALDCGAGVGRITLNLLANYFKTVDLVEQNANFIDEAQKTLSANPSTGHFFTSSLQDFYPTEKYDVIWCQWVLGHLTDIDLILFLKRCALALRANGIIIVKENVSSSCEVIKDEVDSSVTRPSSHFVNIFRKSSLRVIRQAQQKNFPQRLFPVKIYALTPT